MKNLATKFENLTIQNDFIFKKVMSRKRICIHLLEELLQIKIADINYLEAEKSLEPEYTSRGIRLDIIVADDRNTHYNLEMQVKNNKNPDTKKHVLCTSQQILDTNHKKIYNKKLSVSQISVRNATCDIELASDSLTNKLDAVH